MHVCSAAEFWISIVWEIEPALRIQKVYRSAQFPEISEKDRYELVLVQLYVRISEISPSEISGKGTQLLYGD
eukprot:SAG25_NODE_83_length_16558_cov_10.239307_12_plen_72_part_00